MSVDSRHLAAEAPIRAAVLTVSDTRTTQTDHSGTAVVHALEAAGHVVAGRAIVPDDPHRVTERIRGWIDQGDIRIVITTSGTGIARRDSTTDALDRIVERHLPGFGELFRALSFREIGPAAMLSRASAGIIADTAIFVLPGSEHAVRLAMDLLIVPELPHIARELTK